MAAVSAIEAQDPRVRT